MSDTNATLNALLQGMMGGVSAALTEEGADSAAGATTPTAGVEISVANTANIQAQPVEVILQGRRATMAGDTFRSLIAGGSTFQALLDQKFANTSSRRINAVTVTVGSQTNNYQVSSRIPGTLLEATEAIKISFASESGTNG